MYNLTDLLPDDYYSNDNPHLWEGYDPGLATLYEGNCGTRMSRKQWRFETGTERFSNKINKRNSAILPILQHLESFKSASTLVMCERLRNWILHWDNLWEHFGARWWGQQRFHQMIKRQQVLDKIANDVLGHDHSRIAVFGDAVFAPSFRGMPPAPVSLIRNYLARKGRVILVDEFRTSKVCHQCHNITMQHRSTHATKHCQSVCHWSWNRDRNAARNIALLFKYHMAGLDRPLALRRGHQL
jgi:hypothetical protein